MPHVVVDMLSGRTAEQKKQLVEEITEVVARVTKVEPREVTIILQDHSPWEWARGGEFFAEIKARQQGHS